MAKTCEQCINCMYAEHGDMYCDEHEDFAYVYEEFALQMIICGAMEKSLKGDRYG